MTDTDLLIIGGGLAGITVARALRARGDERSITVLAAESGTPYDRPPLSKQVLAGTMAPDEAALLTAGEDLAVDLREGTAAASLDPSTLTVSLEDGSSIRAADIVIATGARVRELADLPRGTPGVHYLRTLADSLALHAALLEARDLVVIGAGFIGLEVASTAASKGLRVTVLEAAPAPLTRVLGPEVGEALVAMHSDEGTDVRCGVTIAGRDEHGILLDDGTVVPADVIVVGVGAGPDVAWLEGSGVLIDDGVVCDGAGRSSRPHVWAVGDAARWPNAVTGQHVRVEQWQAALDQAQVVARNLGGEDSVWESVPYFWSDQCGRKIQFTGRPGPRVQMLDREQGPCALFGDEGLLVGALVTANPRHLAQARKLVAARTPWEQAVEALA